MDSRLTRAYSCYQEGLDCSWNGKKTTDYTAAIKSLTEAYDIFSVDEKNSKIEADTAFCLGYCYFKLSQLSEALLYTQRSNYFYEQAYKLISQDEKMTLNLPSANVCILQGMLGSLIIGLSHYQRKEPTESELSLQKFIQGYKSLPKNDLSALIKANEEIQKIVGNVDLNAYEQTPGLLKIKTLLGARNRAEKTDPVMYNLVRGGQLIHLAAVSYSRPPVISANRDSSVLEQDSQEMIDTEEACNKNTHGMSM